MRFLFKCEVIPILCCWIRLREFNQEEDVNIIYLQFKLWTAGCRPGGEGTRNIIFLVCWLQDQICLMTDETAAMCSHLFIRKTVPLIFLIANIANIVYQDRKTRRGVSESVAGCQCKNKGNSLTAYPVPTYRSLRLIFPNRPHCHYFYLDVSISVLVEKLSVALTLFISLNWSNF